MSPSYTAPDETNTTWPTRHDSRNVTNAVAFDSRSQAGRAGAPAGCAGKSSRERVGKPPLRGHMRLRRVGLPPHERFGAVVAGKPNSAHDARRVMAPADQIDVLVGVERQLCGFATRERAVLES